MTDRLDLDKAYVQYRPNLDLQDEIVLKMQIEYLKNLKDLRFKEIEIEERLALEALDEIERKKLPPVESEKDENSE